MEPFNTTAVNGKAGVDDLVSIAVGGDPGGDPKRIDRVDEGEGGECGIGG